LHVQSPRGRELDSKLRRYSKLGGRRTDNDSNQGPSDPNPPDGVKTPGKPHAPVQEGPAQDSEIDDDDSIED
ncbi:hypothetical protein VDP39_19610, partial [Xanthomonas campestris pv. campestris]|nr:hypothetical protein [Xanthomonas campestris pv. campestris]